MARVQLLVNSPPKGRSADKFPYLMLCQPVRDGVWRCAWCCSGALTVKHKKCRVCRSPVTVRRFAPPTA